MSARRLEGRRGLVAAALARAESWLLEPVDPPSDVVPPQHVRVRKVVAVFGLARGCGATVVSRALAAELAGRDAGAAAVASQAVAGPIALATTSAGRLARALADVPGARTRAVGRLCLVECLDQLALADAARYHAPLVLDPGSAVLGGVPASLADRTLVVAGPRVEPALATVAAACLARVGPEPIVVLNRAPAEGTWGDREALVLPQSRTGARLALAGREPRGELGAAVAALADLCEAAA